MFPQLLYVLEVVPGEQFVEQALHTGEVGTAVLVEELLNGGYLGAVDGVVGLLDDGSGRDGVEGLQQSRQFCLDTFHYGGHQSFIHSGNLTGGTFRCHPGHVVLLLLRLCVCGTQNS